VADGPGRRRLTKDARRAELLLAGEQLFSDRSFDDVSIDDIAAAAGISKNLIYHYFSGKRDLFVSVITESADRMIAATKPDESLEPMARLHASLDAHLRYAEEHAAGYTALLRGAGGDPEVQAIIVAARERVAERVLEGLPLGPTPTPQLVLAARGWIGLVDGLTLHWLETRDLPRDRVRELLAELFVGVFTAAARSGG
jgi:AcrR family transcriptional regulator